jgi:hypothetical protein
MNCDPEWEKTRELLREAHQEPLAQAHFDAVRARVLERLQPRPRRIWWPLWVGASLVAPGGVIWMALVGQVVRLPRTRQGPAPPIAAITRAPEVAPVAPKPKPRVHRAKKPLTEPLLVKLITDDPDVVIYWIADPKGD